MINETKSLFHFVLILCTGELTMDKTTKTQLSLGFFVLGFIMIFIQDLKRLDTINLGFSWPFAIMFYIGLAFMAIGYYLK
jgi:hypothetical protein